LVPERFAKPCFASALQVQQQRSQQRLAATAQQRERTAVQEAVQAAVQVCAEPTP